MINVALIGNWGTAADILTLMTEDSYFNVKMVVTQYDNKNDDKWYNLVWKLAEEFGITVYNQSKFKNDYDSMIDYLLKNNVDIIFSSAYPFLLKKNLIDFMNDRLGIVNIHAGLLPKYRGVSPVIWAIINEEPFLGMTIHYIDEGCDSGDIILQGKIINNSTESINYVTDKLKNEALLLFRKLLTFFKENREIPRKSQDNKLASFAPMIREKHLKIDLGKATSQLVSVFRALENKSPFIVFQKMKYYLKGIKFIKGTSTHANGTIVSINQVDNEIVFVTDDGNILIKLESIPEKIQVGMNILF
jgi:methionyl-tRNA formyltransferase